MVIKKGIKGIASAGLCDAMEQDSSKLVRMDITADIFARGEKLELKP